MPGLLGIDERIIYRVDLARGSHILYLDQNKLYELKTTTRDIKEPKNLAKSDIKPDLPPSDLESQV